MSAAIPRPGAASGFSRLFTRGWGVARFSLVLGWGAASVAAAPVFPLKISETKRALVDQTGAPFLIIGDTAWSLLAQLTETEVDQYLEDRARRGFNAIIVNLLEHKFASRAPNTITGVAPFVKPGYFERPNPSYFDHAHRCLEKARDRGIAVWLCPAYLGVNGGDEGFFQEIKAGGPKAFKIYAHFVAERFKDLDNIVWMVGGDFTPTPEDQWTATALAEVFRQVKPTCLITAHCSPGQSPASAYGQHPWLDLNSTYSYEKNLFEPLAAECAREPTRPMYLLETTYEGEHDSTPPQIRRQAWWALMAGGCGQFFGNAPIWHFGGPGLFRTATTWQEALDSQGSRDIAALGKIMSALPWWQLIPDDKHLLAGEDRGAGTATLLAAHTPDWKLTVVYVPTTEADHRTLSLASGVVPGPVSATWIDPISGAKRGKSNLLPPVSAQGARQILVTPEGNVSGANDWLLVLETAK